MNVIFVLRHTWQVQDKPMANNVAYTSGKLSLHTDYPALHFAPGVSKILLVRSVWKMKQQQTDMVSLLSYGCVRLLRRQSCETSICGACVCVCVGLA